MKLLTVLIICLMLIGCVSAQYRKDLEAARSMFIPAPDCASGYKAFGITGHAPSCISEADADELRHMGVLQ